LLTAVSPSSLRVATQVLDQVEQDLTVQRRQRELQLEQARYEVRLAQCNGPRFYPLLLRVFLELSPPWTGAFLEHSRDVI